MRVKIKKYQLWLLFFFAIFGVTFAMIIWTVKSAVDTPVYEDRSFLSSYHEVDNNYNSILLNNREFLNSYDIEFSINGNVVGLDISDIQLGERAIKKSSRHKDFLEVGENSISISIREISTSESVKDADIKLLLTRAVNSGGDLEIREFNYRDSRYSSKFNVAKDGRWTLTGVVKVNGKKGYFFIKTNTKK